MERTIEQITSEIVELVSNQLGVNNAINLDDRLAGDLGADSIDIIELIMCVERMYDVKLPEHETGEIQTVRNIVNYVFNAINQK